MFTDPRQRNINLGYFGHMWELYALWTWLSAYLAASVAANGSWLADVAGNSILVFIAIGIGCVAAGAMTLGRSPLGPALAALVISGACCALSPVVFGAPDLIQIVFVLVWGLAVIADSPMFSTAPSEAADPRYVGTALTAQMAIVFLSTAAAIRLVPLVVDLSSWRWGLSRF